MFVFFALLVVVATRYFVDTQFRKRTKRLQRIQPTAIDLRKDSKRELAPVDSPREKLLFTDEFVEKPALRRNKLIHEWGRGDSVAQRRIPDVEPRLAPERKGPDAADFSTFDTSAEIFFDTSGLPFTG
ncbi:MAG: hypothetical protein ABEJ65_07335 [bacterium]